jgi:arylamine N-acetyltransferase
MSIHRFRRSPIKLLWLALFSAVLLLLPLTQAQEARYLAVRGPGTASVFWAEGERTAYITDCGRGTSLTAPPVPLNGAETKIIR